MKSKVAIQKYNHFSKLVLVATLFCISIQSSLAQTFPYKLFTEDDGIPSNYVYRVIQDEQGYIWMATLNGISKFDGYRFHNYRVPDGLPHNDVYEILIDYTGRKLLLNDGNSVTFMRNDSFYSTESDLNSRTTVAVLGDSLTIISKACEEEIFYSFDENDQLGIWDRDSFFNLNAKEYQIVKEETGRRPWHQLHFDIENKLKVLIFTDKALLYRSVNDYSVIALKLKDRDSLQYFNLDYNGEVSSRSAIAMRDIIQNEVQISSSHSLMIFDSAFNQTKIEIKLPQKIEINTCYRDAQRNLWISTKNGLILINSEVLDNDIVIDEETRGQNITHVIKAGDGFIYANNQGSIFLVNQRKHSKVYAVNKTGKLEPIYWMELDGNNLFMAYRDVGIITINIADYSGDPLTAKPYHTIDKYRTWDTLDYSFLSQDFTTVKKFTLQKDVFTSLSRRGLLEENVALKKLELIHEKFAEDYVIKDSEYLITLPKGVMKISKGGKLRMHQDLEKTSRVKFLDDRWYFIATDFLQSYVCNDQRCHEIPFFAGLDIKIIQQDELESDLFWIIYSKGIFKTKLDSVLGQLIPIQNYPISQITNCNEVTALVVEAERLVISTNKGIYFMRKEKVNLSEDEINFFLIDVKSTEESFGANADIYVPYSDRSIEIEYTALSYKDKNTVYYEYQLKGADSELETTESRLLRYPDLKSGKYTFHITAFDQLGARSKTLEFDLTIGKPWWSTYWFLSFCIFSLVAILYFLYKRRERQLLVRAEVSQKFAELELNALQSQMNPHFVFNAMGSLQNLIQNNKLDTADQYIAKFASLMRLFLEGSKHKFVSVRDELDIVVAYFELEKLRFQDRVKLNYINQLSDFEMQQRIPANLLQPFVENAISHGIFHKEEGGTIILRMFKKEASLHIEIEDNGVGRKQAQVFKDKRVKHHNSRAIEIINDKILAVQKLEGFDIKYDIEDLFEDGKASGTKVIIVIKS